MGQFYELIISYLGGHASAGRILKGQSPLRLGRRITIEPSETTLRVLHVLIYQFCYLKPVLSIGGLLLEELGVAVHPSLMDTFNPYTVAIGSIRIVSLVVLFFVYFLC